MWMSLARFSTACAIIALTNRMTGASDAISRKCSIFLARLTVEVLYVRLLLGRRAIMPLDRLENLVLRRNHRLDFQSRAAMHRRDRLKVQRIGHRQPHRMIVQRNRQHLNCRKNRPDSVSVSGETAGGPSIVTKGTPS